MYDTEKTPERRAEGNLILADKFGSSISGDVMIVKRGRIWIITTALPRDNRELFSGTRAKARQWLISHWGRLARTPTRRRP